MSMIDINLIKPANDEVRAAAAAHHEAGLVYSSECRRNPRDADALQRALQTLSRTAKAYEDAKSCLSYIVHDVISKAEREETVQEQGSTDLVQVVGHGGHPVLQDPQLT